MQSDYHDPLPLDGLPVWVSDPHNIWKTLRIANIIPLSRLEWLWNSRGTSIRDSSTSARAVFEVSKVKAPAIQVPTRFPHDWYRNPYVYIIVTTLQGLDFSNHSGLTRLRAFVEECREKMHEYLVILSATEADIEKQKRSVDRLRAEVNVAARGGERLVVVPPAAIREEQRPITHLHHSPPHQDLLVRLRECVREGAEARIQKYEEEVSRTFLNRSSKGWSFGNFFVLKEGMAFVFAQLGRRDLAAKFYDELQAMMAERDDTKSMVFCDQSATDTAMGVTNPGLKDYRSLLIANNITEIDLRTYLFARQLSLLVRDRKFADIAERGLKFITAVARRCAEENSNTEQRVSGVFRDAWVFSTSRALASALTPAIPSPSEAEIELTTQLGTPRERHTARLIAGFHVHSLKALMGLAHLTLPHVLAPEEPEDSEVTSAMIAEAKSISDERLRESLSDPKKAECLHAEISNAAASLYEMGGRARGAAALDGDAGIVRLRNGSYSEAEKLLSAQCSRFVNDSGWDDLHKKQRLELARAERALGRVQEYLVSCLTLLYMSRAGRRRWRTDGYSEDEARVFAAEASHWALEAANTAKLLPRVMKYKAERLFDVAVRPNEKAWVEGDPGEATVRIKSDIPTTLKVDCVILECRCASNLHVQSQNSVLHSSIGANDLQKQMDGEPSAATIVYNGNEQSSGFSATSDSGDSSDIVTLRTKTPVDLQEGVNDITVYVDELPQFGRYKVTLAALFIGNLKLVQVASKATPVSIVTMKGDLLSRNAPLSATMSASTDYSNGGVKFPMFFAAQRCPSAFLSVCAQNVLFLAPGTKQFVHIRIVAGQHGVRKGSKLKCALLNQSNVRPAASSRFVTFADITPDDFRGLDQESFIISVRRVNEEPVRYLDVGEAEIEKQLETGEVFECRIIVQTSAGCEQVRDPSLDGGFDYRSCILWLQLSCLELNGPQNRFFACTTEQRLVFSSPVEVSARIEHSSDWGDEDMSVSRAVGLDGTPLGDGGTLICSVESRSKEDYKVTILDAQLELPSWIELRPDEPPAHINLLPCTLCNKSSFTCAFDILVREEAASPENYPETSADSHDNAMFSTVAAERRLSRAIASSSVEGGEDDISHWENEKWSHLSIGEESRNFAMKSDSLVQARHDESHDETEQGEETLQAIDVFQSNPDEKAEDGTSGYLAIYGGNTEDEETITSKEAADVVDLSVPNGQAAKVSPSPAEKGGRESLATLHLRIFIQGINSATNFKRKIDMHALSGLKRRFRIERTVKKSGANGKLMELQFTVQMMESGGLVPATTEQDEIETEVLHYEVDADPTVWMIVGRRRGKLKTTQELSRTGSAKIIPLVCGRQRVPSIRLFKEDGRGLPLSHYENVDDHAQVTIIPNRSIASACSFKRMERTDNGYVFSSGMGVNGKSTMPVVIASDSFFES